MMTIMITIIIVVIITMITMMMMMIITIPGSGRSPRLPPVSRPRESGKPREQGASEGEGLVLASVMLLVLSKLVQALVVLVGRAVLFWPGLAVHAAAHIAQGGLSGNGVRPISLLTLWISEGLTQT